MRMIDADALVWKIMTLCRCYQKEHLVHAEMLEHFTNSVLAYIDHANVPSEDEYVPNKACFDCMERGTRMCKGTIQEQSWCPIVAKTNDLVSRKTLIGAIEKCGEEKIYPQALIETIKAIPSERPSGDLISLQDAIEAVTTWGTNEERNGNVTMAMGSVKQKIVDLLSALPSVDRQKYETFCGVPMEEAYKVMRGYSSGEYAEVVRCKDCRHYEDGMIGHCWETERGVSADFFCKSGERREP